MSVKPPFDVPPTAGLPLLRSDLRWGGDAGLESALARHLGVPQVQLECSGTSALVIALTALQRMAPGRQTVIVPGYTCPLVALAVARCGLRLALCDLAPGSLDLDPVALAALCGPDTLAIVPTHLGGRVVDAAAARIAARAVGAFVIEDAAQALGAKVGRRSVGTDSDIAFFSLAVGKGLTLFEGGVLIARDPALRALLREVSAELAPRRVGWELRRSAELLAYAALYRPERMRMAYGAGLRKALARGDRVAAAGDDFDADIPMHTVGRWRRAVGVRALPRLPAFLAEGAERGRRRAARLATLAPGVKVLRDSPAVTGAAGTWPVLLLLMPDAAARERALQALWGAGCGISLPFVSALPDYERYAGVVPPADPGALPHTRDLAARLLALSNSPWLDEARFESVCRILAQAAAGPRAG
ncbi:nucleotide sugar aminotransferase [Xylophilus rhododendri]|uniref:Nucleotide sugar aminotransferase n=1 Tax=Xylophilus rhododendri TaxID=2697032 RepID=A0A857J950_9BURK|nr:DegT/DnrJ/EryC1/StrS family aminotransferase [Xylophilus rhododendri]QHI99579.1 nucleotide sugar aminotransferase [Xylophilus rhododendri]